MGWFSPKMMVKTDATQGDAEMSQPYEIVIRGQLSPQWNAAFEGLETIRLPDGNTLISGRLPDPSALYGLLMRLRDLGLQLVSVRAVALKEEK